MHGNARIGRECVDVNITYLDGLLITDPPDHPEADVIDLGEVWLHDAYVLQDPDHSLPHTHTRVL